MAEGEMIMRRDGKERWKNKTSKISWKIENWNLLKEQQKGVKGKA